MADYIRPLSIFALPEHLTDEERDAFREEWHRLWVGPQSQPETTITANSIQRLFKRLRDKPPEALRDG